MIGIDLLLHSATKEMIFWEPVLINSEDVRLR